MPMLTNQQVTKINETFQKDHNKIFKNKTGWTFTENDYNFLKKLNRMYGNAMSAKGINLIDPITANMFHYNKMSMRGTADFPRVTRSYVFFTRPELNFSFENINSIPFFKWLYSKRIGKMIMTMLTDPNYFINAPNRMNISGVTTQEIQEIYREMAKIVGENEVNMASKSGDATWSATVSGSGVETEIEPKAANFDEEKAADKAAKSDKSKEEIEAEAAAGLFAINLDELTDDAAMNILGKSASDIKSAYSNFDKAYENYLNSTGNKFRDAVKGITGSEVAYMQKLNELGMKHAASWMNYDKGAPEKFNFTSPFIPLLSNTCTSLDGAKDPSLELHTYEEDKFSSNIQIAKGFDNLWSSGTLSTSFEDIAYGPVSLLFMVWLFYIHYVSRGHITTTREHDTERILDYTCSIYNFVLGSDGRTIERFAKYTGCFPISFPFSQQILHQLALEPDMLQKININWAYNRYEPMDPQIFTDFNFLSESEWLVKLRPSLWENLYDREGNIDGSFVDYGKILKGLGKTQKHAYNELLLRQIKRPKALWEAVQPDNLGMSGQPPAALVDSDFDGMLTNYWGGYPYINDGQELIWVMPDFSTKNGEVLHDEDSGGEFSAPAVTAPSNPDGNNLSKINSTSGTKNLQKARNQ